MTTENIIRHSFTAIVERVNFGDYVKVDAYHLSWKFRVFIAVTDSNMDKICSFQNDKYIYCKGQNTQI